MSLAVLLALVSVASAEDDKDKKPISIDPSLTGETGIITTLVADLDVNQYAVSLAYGLLDNLELSLSVIGLWQVSFNQPFEILTVPPRRLSAFPFPITTTEEGFGDIYIGAKYRFLEDCGPTPGMAVRGFVKIPTGDEQAGFGSGATDFGADLIISKHTGDFLLTANAGLTFLGKPELFDKNGWDIGNDFRFGVGGRYFLNRNVRFVFELTGASAFGDDDLPQSNIIDGRLGVEFKHDNGFRVSVGITRALMFDDPATHPNGAFAMISFSPWSKTYCCRSPLMISGYVRDDKGKPIPGATISFEGAGTALSGDNGFYTMEVPCGYTGTATPAKGDYSFTPASRDYADLQENQEEQNYVGKLPGPFTISGSTRAEDGKPISGVSISATGLSGATTDSAGNYSLTVDYGWSGTVTPSLGDYIWDPTNLSFNNVKSDLSNQNFVGKLLKVEVPCECDIADVYFEFDSAVIREESAAELSKLVECLKCEPEAKIVIEGYCCYIGTEEYNLALGELRANAIKKFLVERGIDAGRIETKSWGEAKPIHDNSKEETRQYNRRGHFIIRKK